MGGAHLDEVDRTKLSIKQKAAELSKKTRSSFRGKKAFSTGFEGRSNSSRKWRLPRERKKSFRKLGFDPAEGSGSVGGSTCPTNSADNGQPVYEDDLTANGSFAFSVCVALRNINFVGLLAFKERRPCRRMNQWRFGTFEQFLVTFVFLLFQPIQKDVASLHFY